MIEVRMRKAPLACVSVEGKGVSSTPGLLGKLLNAIAVKGVRILAVTSGESDLGFFVDQADADVARYSVAQKALRLKGIRDISVLRGLGMITVKGGKVAESQPALQKIYEVLGDAGIVPSAFSAGGDIVRLFFDLKRCEGAYSVLDKNIAKLAELA